MWKNQTGLTIMLQRLIQHDISVTIAKGNEFRMHQVDFLCDTEWLMDKFVIKFIYHDGKPESLAECRARKWNQMNKKTSVDYHQILIHFICTL